ncbi:hypothetical protein D3C80_1418690 [compost metagenome]
MWLLLAHHGLEQFGHGQGTQRVIGIHQDGAVCSQRQCGTQLLLCAGRAHADHYHFGGNALFLQTNRLFHGDFAEGVHRHFHVSEVDAGTVRLDADFHVVVDHALYSSHYSHGELLVSGLFQLSSRCSAAW